MLNQGILNTKKAISPLLATLLLVVIALSAIIVTYAWTTTYMGNPTDQEAVPYKANVYFQSAGSVVIDIGNSGTADTEIIALYVGTSESTAASQTTSPQTPIPLSAGSIASLSVGYEWVQGQTYYFKVVTAAGQTPLVFQEQAPQ